MASIAFQFTQQLAKQVRGDALPKGGMSLAALERTVSLVRATQSFNYAAITLLIYDMILTMQQEIEIVWRARWTAIKFIYLINRYITPFFMLAHVWVFSGRAYGLTDTSCRVIYSVAAVAEIFSVSFVSLVIIIRLYAVYELSNRAFYSLLTYWLHTFLVFTALTIPNLWARLDSKTTLCALSQRVHIQGWSDLLDDPVTNCAGTRPTLSFPCSQRHVDTPVVALWRFKGSTVIGSTSFTVGLFLTMATSRLLLNLKDAEFKHQSVPVGGAMQPNSAFVQKDRALTRKKLMAMAASNDFNHDPASSHAYDEAGGPMKMRTLSDLDDISLSHAHHAHNLSNSTNASSSTTRRSIWIEQMYIKQRAWWLLSCEYVPTETRIFISRTHESDEESILEGAREGERDGYEGDGESNASIRERTQKGQVVESRLGRFDYWL
ncbi:hypothetical protein PIIN_05062 [Serendipita indica DSM 11827]|uniref:DUF6533 domain-containing protein n=1 Tax=Serendipita indica (strain DSM 11827) TaxID=1109443 RepID=G4TII4_SERID|nr:hypothetical protein PIIN_05062 [Serendipita indica DSM 11827]